MKKKIIGIVAAVVVIGIIIAIFSGNSEKTDDEKLVAIESIEIQENYKDISIKADSLLSKEGYVSATIKRNSDLPFDELNNFIEFFIEDTNIATVKSITFDETTEFQLTNTLSCVIEGVDNGTTIGYFQSKDGKVKSEQITISVSGMTNENEKAKFDSLVNSSLKNAINLTKELGYTAKYTNAQSNYDFTETITAFDETELEKWIIVECVTIDTAAKKVEFSINTKENIQENENNEQIEKALSEKLSSQNAWNAVIAYGNEAYPYGFKVTYSNGFTEKAKDENTWFLKARAKITNGYNAKREIEFEAYVTGTNDNPEVIEFTEY